MASGRRQCRGPKPGDLTEPAFLVSASGGGADCGGLVVGGSDSPERLAHQEGSIALGEAPLGIDPVGVAFVGLADGAAVEGPQAAEPRHDARRLASPAERRELEFELVHGPTVADDNVEVNQPVAEMDRYLSRNGAEDSTLRPPAPAPKQLVRVY